MTNTMLTTSDSLQKDLIMQLFKEEGVDNCVKGDT